MLHLSILQYFWPALSDNLSWKPIFVFFLSGRLRQVLLYMFLYNNVHYRSKSMPHQKVYWNISILLKTFINSGKAVAWLNITTSVLFWHLLPDRIHTWPRGYKTWVQSQTQNKTQWLAACGHVSASSQSLRFILSLSFITSKPDLCRCKKILNSCSTSLPTKLLVTTRHHHAV